MSRRPEKFREQTANNVLPNIRHQACSRPSYRHEEPASPAIEFPFLVYVSP
jgi:hypothetical protein